MPIKSKAQNLLLNNTSNIFSIINCTWIKIYMPIICIFDKVKNESFVYIIFKITCRYLLQKNLNKQIMYNRKCVFIRNFFRICSNHKIAKPN